MKPFYWKDDVIPDDNITLAPNAYMQQLTLWRLRLPAFRIVQVNERGVWATRVGYGQQVVAQRSSRVRQIAPPISDAPVYTGQQLDPRPVLHEPGPSG